MNKPENKKIRICCLHGYGTNRLFLQRQMRSFKRELGKEVQFFFIQGDIPAPKAYILDEKVLKIINGQPKSWTSSTSYHLNYEKYTHDFLENIKAALESQSQYYDGILGFSQGATMTHALLKFIQSGKIAWKCLENLKFCIMVCGTHWHWNETMRSQLQIPSLHLLSKADFLFRKSLFLTTQFDSPITIYHPFGHSFPRLGRDQISQIKYFMRKIMKNQLQHGNLQLLPKL